MLSPRAFLLALGSCAKTQQFSEALFRRFPQNVGSSSITHSLRGEAMKNAQYQSFSSSPKAFSPAPSQSMASWIRGVLIGSTPTGVQGTVVHQRMRLKELLWCYSKLSKIRLSGFVVSTACAGYVLGSGEEVEWSGLLCVGLGTLGAAACANTLNQLMEVKNDAMMSRTMARPLPSGRISRGHALAFALITGSSAVALLAAKANTLTAMLGAANIGLYAGVYTPLKQITPANTWVGAVVGAIPPLMGWAAASGQLDPGAWILAATLYFWQIPHFLSLAWVCKDDYAKAGFEMLSKYDPLGRRLASISLRNCFYMFPIGIFSVLSGVTTTMFAYEAGILSVLLALSTSMFYSRPSRSLGRATFRASLMFLPIFMLGMLVHRQPNTSKADWETVKEKIMTGFFPFLGETRQGDNLEVSLNIHNLQSAPFPFVMVPSTLPLNMWEGLDEVITEEEQLRTQGDGGDKQ